MKLPCRVKGHPAMIVGYANAKRAKLYAVVITQGELRAVRLRDIELLNVPVDLAKSPAKLMTVTGYQPRENGNKSSPPIGGSAMRRSNVS